jgi:hypothetical protein
LPPRKGWQEKKNGGKKTMYVRSLFGLDFVLDLRRNFFYIAFLSSPYRDTPKNATTKSRKKRKMNKMHPEKKIPSKTGSVAAT